MKVLTIMQSIITGNVNSALMMTNELLEIEPNHERATGNKFYYEKELAKQKSKKKLRGDDGTAEVDEDVAVIDTTNLVAATEEIKPSPVTFNLPEKRVYEMLCRGDLKQTPKQLAKLSCRYVTNSSPFLKIGPLKLEEANLVPYIVLYHEVISDKEIEVVKEMAKPRVSA